MDKTNIVNTFTNYVDQLRNTECSQKEKIACFQHIAECILSAPLAAHINYATHCSTATNVLLLFCEDLDSTVRMSAEENLNRIFRALEGTRVSRILLDLYGEIKRNGNQRSLRICLNLFAYYAPQVKEKQVKWYALRLSACLQTMAQRKETLLCESLCEFVKSFGNYLQVGLTDSETCKLLEVFMMNIGVECAVKRRCSSQNCISLIENSRNKILMAKHGLNKVIALLLADQQANTILGALGFLRILLPHIIRGFADDCNDSDCDNATPMPRKRSNQQSDNSKNAAAASAGTTNSTAAASSTPITNECKQIIEVFDYCLHLLSISHTSNHSVINASLEVINAILQAIDGSTGGNSESSTTMTKSTTTTTAQCLQQLLSNQQLQHNEYLRRRKSLKNQIFQLKNYEMTSATVAATTKNPASWVSTATAGVASQTRKHHQRQPVASTQGEGVVVVADDDDNEELNKHKTGATAAEMHDNELLLAARAVQQQRQNIALKLGMQKIANVQEVGILMTETTMTTATKTSSPAEAATKGMKTQTTPTTIVGIHAQDDNGKNVTDDVDEHDNDDEAHKTTLPRCTNVGKQQIKYPKNIAHHAKDEDDTNNYDNYEDDDVVAAAAYDNNYGDGKNIVLLQHHNDDDDADEEDEEEDDDDFTTLSEINEPQKAFALTTAAAVAAPPLTTTIDVDNLLDAIDATAKTEQHILLTTAEAVAASLSDDKSQQLSDIDNESFNSIDFEAEISIAGMVVAVATMAAGAAADGATERPNIDESNATKSSSDTIGSFFNNLLTHPSTESMTKLFRSSPAAPKITTSKAPKAELMVTTPKTTTTGAAEKTEFDGISLSADTLSLVSFASSNQRPTEEESSPAGKAAAPTRKYSSSSGINDETLSTTASVTASTAILLESNSRQNVMIDVSSDEEQTTHPQSTLRRRTTNINPFLLQNSPSDLDAPLLNVDIGSIFEQPIVYYATRLICARFLLAGTPAALQSDQTTRVSIKNLSLCVVAQCVRLAPQLLTLGLEISAAERRIHLTSTTRSVTPRAVAAPVSLSSHSSSASGSPTQPHSDSSSSNLGKDYEHLDAGGDVVDFARLTCFAAAINDDADDQLLLLDIKDDHFGQSTTDCLLNQPLSRSIDTALLAAHVTPPVPKRCTPLSRSEIIGSTSSHNQSAERSNTSSPPPRPPKRFKSLRRKFEKLSMFSKKKQGNSTVDDTTDSIEPVTAHVQATPLKTSKPCQQIVDVLLFYTHVDPILRGGVQQIIGNFIQSSSAGMRMRTHIQLNQLLAILIKGLQDDIHTVVIHALNAFDKAFPPVLAKYLTGSATAAAAHFCCSHYEQQQRLQQTTTTAAENNAEKQDQKNPNDAFTRKLCPRTCAATTCAPQLVDNDELISMLLNAFQLRSKNAHVVLVLDRDKDKDNERKDENEEAAALTADDDAIDELLDADSDKDFFMHVLECVGEGDGDVVDWFVSPKLLLNKLRLCYHNKYWLVQNKYAEVISNLNYAVLREFYIDESDVVATYETSFLDELLQLIGDDDFRVREHAADCLCRFIIQNAKQQQQSPTNVADINSSKTSAATAPPSGAAATFETNFNLLWDFFDYRIFGGMSQPLRNLFMVQSSIAPPLTSLATTKINCNRFTAFAMQRQMAQEEKLLARVLYRLTNKLMELNDKNSQFGIIYTLKLLLKHFNFVDYQGAWTEFNFMEICMKYSCLNYATAVDLNCQNDLIDVTGKLMAGYFVSNSNNAQQQQLLDSLLTHNMKLLNIYYHIFSNQKPLLFAKSQKTDLFSNAKELAIVQCCGYFGGDYVYVKLYGMLKSSHESYKITINQAAGSSLMSLLRTCINTLSLCIELRSNNTSDTAASNTAYPAPATLKLIEEILQYLSRLINYAAGECIACLRQLLKYLFGRNYGNRQQDYYGAFVEPYFRARRRRPTEQVAAAVINSRLTMSTRTMTHNLLGAKDSPSQWALLGELLANGLNFHSWRAEQEEKCALHIKLFEPLVINCLMLFMKSNARVQAPILELLSLLLDLNVKYSILDSKNVIFDQIINNLELIESGIARNGRLIIPSMMKFLIQLTNKSDRKLITIPKIISIANNLLANNGIRDCAVLALKSLAYEVFFMGSTTSGGAATAQESEEQRAAFQSPISRSPMATPVQQRRQLLSAEEAAAAAELLLTSKRELETQKEVVLGMLEKFIDANECQHVLGLLLLRERSMQQKLVAGSGEQQEQQEVVTVTETELLPDPGAVFALVCRALCEGRLRANDWADFLLLDALFTNCGKLVLADSKDFASLLQLFIVKNVDNFSNLSHATIILENVILKTEEIYLLNHIKLYLKNHQANNAASTAAAVGAGRWPRLPDGPSTSTAAAAALAGSRITTGSSSTLNEINYFAKVLCEKLDECLATLTGHAVGSKASTTTSNSNGNSYNFSYDRKYCGLAARFIRALHAVCCSSRLQDALQPVLRLALDESNVVYKYNALLTEGLNVVDDAVSSSMPQLELLKLLSAMRLLDTRLLLQQLQAPHIRRHVRSNVLRTICEWDPDAINWSLQQVQQLFHEAFLNILIAENFAFVCSLCEVDEEFCSLWLSALIDNCAVLQRHSIRILLRHALRFCTRCSCSIQNTAKFLQLLAQLHKQRPASSMLAQLIERTARWLIAAAPHHDRNAIYDSFMGLMDDNEMRTRTTTTTTTTEGTNGRLQYILLNDLENLHTRAQSMQFEQRIIDEKWLFAQLIKFSSQPDYDPQKLTRILLDIQSEHKLHKILTSADFDLGRALQPAIVCALRAMLSTFRHNCTQHNPHIHYMQPNPLARVACAVLMTRIAEVGDDSTSSSSSWGQPELLQLAAAVISLMDNIKQIEATALIYIEARFVQRFVREHLLRPADVVALLHFLGLCCAQAKQCLNSGGGLKVEVTLGATQQLLRCIDALLAQKLIWCELNQVEKAAAAATADVELDGAGSALTHSQRNKLLCDLVELLWLAASKSMHQTIFYKRYKPCVEVSRAADELVDCHEEEAVSVALAACLPKVIFIAKLIETQIDMDAASGAALCAAHITGRGGATATGSAAGAAAAVGGSVGAAVGSGGGGVGAIGGGGVGGVGGMHSDESLPGIEMEGERVPMNFLKSIGISILRTNQFYAYAVTPLEIIQQQQRQQQQHLHQQQLQQHLYQQQQNEQQQDSVGSTSFVEAPATPSKRVAATAAASSTTAIGKLPTIPVESLSDVDVLRKFVKRLSVFGFTTRQQFEEYFMTFLLLINKVYDENMVDQQEEFQIKSTCLEAILELLITYKTFPIVGNKLSSFHHTTRWSRINCDGISLKKLHNVQLLVSESNIFYHPNLERQLSAVGHNNNGLQHDNIIGTKRFLSNQMDLNFVWQQMEAFAQPAATAMSQEADETNAARGSSGDGNILTAKHSAAITSGEDATAKNYRYFTANSGIDFKSSAQLIFDVMMQLIEHNHILVLPNLVKFCEICESRDQIKWIKDKALKLQESIPMDDTISHQHIIYLLCKTQAMLIPTLGELQHLGILIVQYLRSSHVFIRNATLAGLLALLECGTKTNPTIGRLSDELTLLRDLILGYINRHGLIDPSSIQCSDLHTKLVWTLNFSLIEWTSKLVPQCHLLSNSIIAAGNLLPKTINLSVYLCVLHGLERMVVISNTSGNNNIVSPVLRHKIEKLALELVKLENEKFSIPALKLLLSCMYVGSAKQLENTELSNGIVQDDPEIIAQQTDKVDILLHCIKSSTRSAAWIYGQVLCQIIRDLVPPNEILTKVIKEFLAVNQPHCDVIAMIVYQVFRSAIDSSFLPMLQDWLICSLPTFLALPAQKGVWGLSVIFLSASINLHLIKLFPVVLGAREFRKLGQHEIALFVTAAQDFHAKLSAEQRTRFCDAFQRVQQNQIYAKMLHSL